MLKAGAAKKVTIYVGEDEQYHGHSHYAAILEFLFNCGVAGASVTRGIAGFGASHHLHTTRILRLTENLPIKIEFIESPEKLGEILPKLQEIARRGLITVQDAEIIQFSQHPSAPSSPSSPESSSPAPQPIAPPARLARGWWRLLESLFTRRPPKP
jgi:PII-like signaling protein